MKKKTLIAFLLLAVGIVLILGAAIAAAIYLELKVGGGTGIIGGADSPTYFVVLRHAYNGLFSILGMIGVLLALSSIPVFLKKSN